MARYGVPGAFRIWVAAFLVSLFSGCSDNGEYTTVDFSRVQKEQGSGKSVKQQDALSVAIAALVSPKETFSRYRELLDHIARRIGRPVQLVQRKTYREVVELFATAKLDAAFICSCPVENETTPSGLAPLVAPVIRGRPLSQAYLIVNKESAVNNFEALRGLTFAFTDPDSSTGALIPEYWLARMRETPDRFFSSYTYTYSHDNSIMAVAKLLVDAATVDGHIWEYYHTRSPTYTARTRVIDRSMLFGSPPLVVSGRLPPDVTQAMKEALLLMHMDESGRRILDALMIDRFVVSEKSWYEPLNTIRRELAAFRERTP